MKTPRTYAHYKCREPRATKKNGGNKCVVHRDHAYVNKLKSTTKSEIKSKYAIQAINGIQATSSIFIRLPTEVRQHMLQFLPVPEHRRMNCHIAVMHELLQNARDQRLLRVCLWKIHVDRQRGYNGVDLLFSLIVRSFTVIHEYNFADRLRVGHLIARRGYGVMVYHPQHLDCCFSVEWRPNPPPTIEGYTLLSPIGELEPIDYSHIPEEDSDDESDEEYDEESD
jgi:hypothetical protein